jgi:hypothetical protein
MLQCCVGRRNLASVRLVKLYLVVRIVCELTQLQIGS